jgi:hypothetical protein
MKAWKIIGYVFVILGTLFVFYGFSIGFMETINPSTIFSINSSDSSFSSFFSLFWSAIAPWITLATFTFIVAGWGLYAGREKKAVKSSNDQELINLRLKALEETVAKNFLEISKRLDKMDEH